MAQGSEEEIERHEALAKEILTRRGQPSSQEFALAEAFVAENFRAIGGERANGLKSENAETRWTWILSLTCAYGLAVVIVPCWLASLTFRGGVLLRAFGLAVVKRNGEPASRGRVLWRSFIASVSFLIATVVLRGQSGFWASIPLCLAIIMAVASALNRGRTLQDRLAGTDLVPR
jgi:hypothetical protein